MQAIVYQRFSFASTIRCDTAIIPHFRRKVLEEVLGWDPFNVTEDADLGVRLSRAGYRSGTLTCPTLEEAPEDFKVWLGQRTRWFKGWMQCWLVHNRNMNCLWKELRFKKFVVSQIFLGGIIISALIYPISVFIILSESYKIFSGEIFSILRKFLLFADILNVSAAHAGFYMLGCRSQSIAEQKKSKARFFFLPAYWLIMSWAGWRAVIDLMRRPHHWEKTDHKPMATYRPPEFRIRK